MRQAPVRLPTPGTANPSSLWRSPGRDRRWNRAFGGTTSQADRCLHASPVRCLQNVYDADLGMEFTGTPGNVPALCSGQLDVRDEGLKLPRVVIQHGYCLGAGQAGGSPF